MFSVAILTILTVHLAGVLVGDRSFTSRTFRDASINAHDSTWLTARPLFLLKYQRRSRESATVSASSCLLNSMILR